MSDVYENKGAMAATIVVAASNSLNKGAANYVCDGTDDQLTIQAAIDALPVGGGKVLVLEGIYNLSNSVWNQNKDYVTLSGMGGGTVFKPTAVVESTLTVGANPADPTITVADGSLFKENQQIMICTKDYVTDDKEPRRITNITGNVLTLDANLALAHGIGDAVYTAFRCIEASDRSSLIFENFRIDGNKASQYYYSQCNDVCNPVGGGNKIIFRIQNGVHIDNCSECIVENVRVDDIAGWGGVVAAKGDHNNIISCVCDTGVNRGIIAFEDTYSSIATSSCSRNGCATTKLGHGICVEATTCFRVTGNHTDFSYSDGYYIWSTGNLIVIDSNTSYHDPTGINAAVADSVITNNSIQCWSDSKASWGISSSVGGCIIANNRICLMNKFSVDEGYGIRVNTGGASCDNIMIADNIIDEYLGAGYFATKVGIYVKGIGATNVHVSGNTVGGEYTVDGIEFGANANPYINMQVKDNIVDLSGATPVGILFDETGADVDNFLSGNRVSGATTPISFTVPSVGNGWRRYNKYSDLFQDVLAVSATHVRSNNDLSAGIPLTFTLDAQPDVPRTLSGHFDAHAQITAYTIVITGVNAKGDTITETITEVSGWDWETSNAFAMITSIIMTARTGTGAGDTMDIGITDVLGLSNIIYETGDVYKIKKNNANAVVAVAQVNVTYDTYDMAVIGLAATDDFTLWYKSNLNIIS